MAAMLDGGKAGVEMGMAIIPGVLINCSLVLLLTNGPADGGLYTGGAYEGVAFLPWVGEQISGILRPLFGFASPEAIAVPITALGAAGAAIGLIPKMLETGAAGGNEIAVFTAQCINFPLQRNITFKSDGNPIIQAIWYFIGWVAISILVNAVWGFVGPVFSHLITSEKAITDLLKTFITGGLSMVVFFFIFKIIFPEGEAKKE